MKIWPFLQILYDNILEGKLRVLKYNENILLNSEDQLHSVSIRNRTQRVEDEAILYVNVLLVVI